MFGYDLRQKHQCMHVERDAFLWHSVSGGVLKSMLTLNEAIIDVKEG